MTSKGNNQQKKRVSVSPQAPLFDELVQNAFDFLEAAINEFKEKPKYSVIHFCTAIELLLKARLMHEHWSLIVDGEPNIQNFKAGKFKSIGFSGLVPRIDSVLGDKIPSEAKACFSKIADHRNRMVHFFHEAASYAGEKLVDEIVFEQCSGWFYLRRLLEKWSDVFDPYKHKIDVFNQSMKAHREYLRTVYDKIKNEIDLEKKKGIIYRVCSSCQFEAGRENALTEHIIESTCRVCLLKEHVLRVTCGCGKTFDIMNGEEAKCPCCGVVMETENLDEQLNTDPVTHDNYFDREDINCGLCSGHNTVIPHEKYYICLECFGVEEEMGVCEWCNEGQIGGGNLENSYQVGCEFCDGHAGWHKDD